MTDWGAIGIAAAGILSGAGGWLRERQKRKRIERTEGGQPWDGETERRGPELQPPGTITGRYVVELIDRDGADLPREWRRDVEAIVVHKLNNALAAPLLRMQALEDKVEELRKSMERVAEALGEGQTEVRDMVQRIIGRLFPNEPLGR